MSQKEINGGEAPWVYAIPIPWHIECNRPVADYATLLGKHCPRWFKGKRAELVSYLPLWHKTLWETYRVDLVVAVFPLDSDDPGRGLVLTIEEDPLCLTLPGYFYRRAIFNMTKEITKKGLWPK